MGTGCGQGANRYTSETNMSAQRFILGNPKGEEDRHLLLWLPRDSTLLVIDVKAVFCFFAFFLLKGIRLLSSSHAATEPPLHRL